MSGMIIQPLGPVVASINIKVDKNGTANMSARTADGRNLNQAIVAQILARLLCATIEGLNSSGLKQAQPERGNDGVTEDHQKDNGNSSN